MTHDPDTTSALPALRTAPTPPLGIPLGLPLGLPVGEPPGGYEPGGHEPGGYEPGGRRRVRLWGLLSAGFVALLVVVVAADRAAALILSRRATAQLSCMAGASSNVSARVTGFPVLPSLIGGTLPRVEAHADRYTVPAGTVTDVDVTADGVVIPKQDGALRIGSVDGSFTVPYSYLPATTNGTAMSYAAAPNGLIAITARFGLGGVELPVTLTARPVIDAGRVTIEPAEVQAFGIRQSASAFTSRIAPYLPQQSLPDLAPGLRFTSVEASSGGLRFGFAGRQVALTPSAGAPASGPPARCG